jgi:hypothetical protein
MIFVTDGWIAASYLFVWQIALFLSLGESFTGFGAAMALAALVGAVGGLLSGVTSMPATVTTPRGWR